MSPLQKKLWYERIPNAFIIIFLIMVLVAVLTYIIPSGQFERIMMENGREGVDPDSFHYIEKSPSMKTSPFDLFRSIPIGMVQAGTVMMIVFLAGGMFKILQESGAMENGIGMAVRKIEEKNISPYWGLALLTLLFGFFGAAVGFENLIGFVPLGIMVALGLGFDLMVGAGAVIGALAVGFATSPINAYTVGVAHEIAGLPTFSGMGLRTIYVLVSLALMYWHMTSYMKKVEKDPTRSLVKGISTEGLTIDRNQLQSYHLDTRGKIMLLAFFSFIAVVVYGVVVHQWYLDEIAALFVIYAIIFAVISGMSSEKMVQTFIKGASAVTGGALIVGLARAIQVIMAQGEISDTIIYNLSLPLRQLSPILSAIAMTIVQGVINFFIPSGSGQAMVTMPIIVPLSDIINVGRQIAVLAFQIGDGVTNMIIPTSGGLLAMLAIARVPFDKWFRFIIGLVVKVYIAGWIILAIATLINWQ